MKTRAEKIELMVADDVKWGIENQRGCNEDKTREYLEENLSDEELDKALRMRGVEI